MKKFNKTLVQLLCPFGNWKHTKGMQIVDKVSGEKLVKNFGGIFRAKIPVYIGHPDENPKTAQAAKAVGQIDKLFLCENSIAAIVRYEESVYKKIVLGEIRAMSPRWQMERVNAENFRPVKLVSVGLTNNPNIPESGKLLCPELPSKNPAIFSLVEKCKNNAEISLNTAKKCAAKSRKILALQSEQTGKAATKVLAKAVSEGAISAKECGKWRELLRTNFAKTKRQIAKKSVHAPQLSASEIVRLAREKMLGQSLAWEKAYDAVKSEYGVKI